MTAEAVRAHERAAGRLAIVQRFGDLLRLGTALFVVVLLAMVAYLGYRLDQADAVLHRQDCIAHVNGIFSGHLADALGQQPASLDRQDFLDKMKSDAQRLEHLDVTCPK